MISEWLPPNSQYSIHRGSRHTHKSSIMMCELYFFRAVRTQMASLCASDSALSPPLVTEVFGVKSIFMKQFDLILLQSCIAPKAVADAVLLK